MLPTKNYVDRPKTKSAKSCFFFIEKVHILRITHFSETTKDRSLIFGKGGDANVKLCIQHFLSPGLICLVTLIINIYGLGWGSRSHFFKQIPQ
jgi:hypothetical protein